MYNITYFCSPKIMDSYGKKLFDLMSPFSDITLRLPITGATELDGVLLDFNSGLRLQIPEGNWYFSIKTSQKQYWFQPKNFLSGGR